VKDSFTMSKFCENSLSRKLSCFYPIFLLKVLTKSSPMHAFNKVYAGKEMDKLFAETEAEGTLLHREVHWIIDSKDN